MKIRAFVLAIPVLAILALCVLGCQLSATIVTEDDFNVRIVNRSGGTVKLRWDETSYRYLDDGCYIVLSPVDSGYHKIEWEDTTYSRSKTRSNQTFKLVIDADIEIVIQDDEDVIIIDL